MKLHLFSHENTCQTFYNIWGGREDIAELVDIFEKLSDSEYECWVPVKVFLEALEYEIKPEDSLKGWVTDYQFDDDMQEVTFTVYSKRYRIGAIQYAIEALCEGDLFVRFETQEFGLLLFDSNVTYEGGCFPSVACFTLNSEAVAFFNTEQEAVDYVNDYFGKEVCTDLYSASYYVQEHERAEDGFINLIVKKYTDYGEYPPIVV